MIRSKAIRSSALILSVAVALSCSSDNSPTGPAASATGDNGLLSDAIGTVTGLVGSVLKVVVAVVDPNGIDVHAIQWAPTHVNEVRSVSATIGVNGGTLSIPGSDFTITFPYGALAAPTAITITSDASGYVSYDMQPHGTVFARPVIVTQRLKNTSLYGTPQAWNSFGAYFQQDPLDLSGLLKALETTTTTIFAAPSGGQPEVETWQLRHFSRYMLASG
jgi:hypothetical protein